MVIKPKAYKKEIHSFIEKGGDVASDKKKNVEFTVLSIRVPNIILKELDEELEKKPWVSRNHWIVEALAEKLIKLGEK